MITSPAQWPESREQLTSELKAIIRNMDKYKYDDKTNQIPEYDYCDGVTYIPTQVVLNCLEGEVSNESYPCDIESLRRLIKNNIAKDLYSLECVGWVSNKTGEMFGGSFHPHCIYKGCSYIPAAWVAYSMGFNLQ